MNPLNQLTLLGFASGVAANNPDCALGPWYLYYHPQLFLELALNIRWEPMIHATSAEHGLNVLPLVEKKLEELGRAVLPHASNRQPFCVIGGDHSCGIATWSAVAHANREKGDIGLIWIDAHMDSHTLETTSSHNIHGMPVAHLLGEGKESLHQLLDHQPKIKPSNMCLVGVRSYQNGEAALLERLGVKIYFIEEVLQRGIDVVLEEACQHVSQSTCGFGVSIDLDAVDPIDAPGVGCPEPGGIVGEELVVALRSIAKQHLILGLEIAEFNPINDQNQKTAKLMVNLLKAVYSYPSCAIDNLMEKANAGYA